MAKMICGRPPLLVNSMSVTLFSSCFEKGVITAAIISADVMSSATLIMFQNGTKLYQVKAAVFSFHRQYSRDEYAPIFIVSAYRYIATTTLPITAVFLEYLRHFLIDFNQIYRHSSVPKKHVSVHFSSFLAQAVSEHGAAVTFFVMVSHGVANPTTASH